MLEKLKAIHTNAHLRCQPPPFHIVEMCVNEAPTATFRQFCCVFLRSQELCELLRNAHNSQRDLLLKEAVIPAVGNVAEPIQSSMVSAETAGTSVREKKRRGRE